MVWSSDLGYDPDEWEECADSDHIFAFGFFTRVCFAAVAIGVAGTFLWFIEARKEWKKVDSASASASADSESKKTSDDEKVALEQIQKTEIAPTRRNPPPKPERSFSRDEDPLALVTGVTGVPSAQRDARSSRSVERKLRKQSLGRDESGLPAAFNAANWPTREPGLGLGTGGGSTTSSQIDLQYRQLAKDFEDQLFSEIRQYGLLGGSDPRHVAAELQSRHGDAMKQAVVDLVAREAGGEPAVAEHLCRQLEHQIEDAVWQYNHQLLGSEQPPQNIIETSLTAPTAAPVAHRTLEDVWQRQEHSSDWPISVSRSENENGDLPSPRPGAIRGVRDSSGSDDFVKVENADLESSTVPADDIEYVTATATKGDLKKSMSPQEAVEVLQLLQQYDVSQQPTSGAFPVGVGQPGAAPNGVNRNRITTVPGQQQISGDQQFRLSEELGIQPTSQTPQGRPGEPGAPVQPIFDAYGRPENLDAQQQYFDKYGQPLRQLEQLPTAPPARVEVFEERTLPSESEDVEPADLQQPIQELSDLALKFQNEAQSLLDAFGQPLGQQQQRQVPVQTTQASEVVISTGDVPQRPQTVPGEVNIPITQTGLQQGEVNIPIRTLQQVGAAPGEVSIPTKTFEQSSTAPVAPEFGPGGVQQVPGEVIVPKQSSQQVGVAPSAPDFGYPVGAQQASGAIQPTQKLASDPGNEYPYHGPQRGVPGAQAPGQEVNVPPPAQGQPPSFGGAQKQIQATDLQQPQINDPRRQRQIPGTTTPDSSAHAAVAEPTPGAVAPGQVNLDKPNGTAPKIIQSPQQSYQPEPSLQGSNGDFVPAQAVAPGFQQQAQTKVQQVEQAPPQRPEPSEDDPRRLVEADIYIQDAIDYIEAQRPQTSHQGRPGSGQGLGHGHGHGGGFVIEEEILDSDKPGSHPVGPKPTLSELEHQLRPPPPPQQPTSGGGGVSPEQTSRLVRTNDVFPGTEPSFDDPDDALTSAPEIQSIEIPPDQMSQNSSNFIENLPEHHVAPQLQSPSFGQAAKRRSLDRPPQAPQLWRVSPHPDDVSISSSQALRKQSSVMSIMNVTSTQEVLLQLTSLEQLAEALRKAGLESTNLIYGIDYTASNKYQGEDSFGGLCLHAVGEAVENPYQQVIRIMGRSLATFATSGDIPVYGFGDARTGDWSVFALKEDGPCESLEDVLAAYNDVTPSINLSGPTNFAPLIYEAIRICQRVQDYHILVIIADGQVTNERATRKAICHACKYPLSIIVVGVGDGPWDMMRVFDESLPKRPWDNFHFIEFRQLIKIGRKAAKPAFSHDPELAFAVSALLEIPDQYATIRRLGLIRR